MIIKQLLKTDLFRYMIVGGGAVSIDFIVYFFLINNNMDPASAKRYSFISGGLWSFFANKFYTFRKSKVNIREPFLFAIVYFIGFMLNSLIHDWILSYTAIKIIALFVATIVSVLWNYIGQKWLVFNKNL